MKILVQRAGGLGDVILVTPIVRLLARQYPHADITVATHYPQVFAGSIYCTATSQPEPDGWDRIISLDLAYEKRPQMHVVLAYLIEAKLDTPDDLSELRQELFFNPASMLPSVLGQGPFVAVHAARAGWKNRTLPDYIWRQVVEGLQKHGCKPVLVGSPIDDLSGVDCLRFLTAREIAPQAQLINSCACFVGSDSALLHVAGATDTPIVGLYTSVDPLYRRPFRGAFTPLVPELACRFCQGRRPVPATDEHCERIPSEQNLCAQMGFTAERIVATVMDTLHPSSLTSFAQSDGKSS